MANFPQAGAHQKGQLTEHWSLAPLPIPTGYPPIPQQVNLKKYNPTTLELGNSDYWNFEFGLRLSFGWCALVFWAFFMCHCFLFIVELKYEDIWPAFYNVSLEMLHFYKYLGGLLVFFIIIFFIALFKDRAQEPIRFNRERRKVYAMGKGKHFIAPWEAVSAQVEVAAMVSPYAFTDTCTLTLQIPDAEGEEFVQIMLSYPLQALAIAEWEAIRVFMEEGLESLNQKSKSSDELKKEQLAKNDDPAPKGTTRYYREQLEQYQEGSVNYFYALKALNKHKKKGYYWWCFKHLSSGWTIPCHVAQFLNKHHPKKPTPKAILEWCKAIPQTQWAKPSQALQEQSAELNQAYQKTKLTNFQAYYTRHPVPTYKPIPEKPHPPKQRKLPG